MTYQARTARVAKERHVAIYNDDDWSHLTHHDNDHGLHYPTVHDKSSVEPYTRHGHSMFMKPAGASVATVSHANETTILFEHDSDSEGETFTIPHSPIGSHRASLCSEDFQFPIFLGRQAEATAAPQENVDQAPQVSASNEVKPRRDRNVRFVPPEDHVSAIEGQLMSWWPAPMELMEHQWVDTKSEQQDKLQAERHVSSIEGPMMAFWPMPIEMMEYDWH